MMEGGRLKLQGSLVYMVRSSLRNQRKMVGWLSRKGYLPPNLKTEFNLWNLHARRRALNPTGCPLTATLTPNTLHLRSCTHLIHMHTQ